MPTGILLFYSSARFLCIFIVHIFQRSIQATTLPAIMLVLACKLYYPRNKFNFIFSLCFDFIADGCFQRYVSHFRVHCVRFSLPTDMLSCWTLCQWTVADIGMHTIDLRGWWPERPTHLRQHDSTHIRTVQLAAMRSANRSSHSKK